MIGGRIGYFILIMYVTNIIITLPTSLDGKKHTKHEGRPKTIKKDKESKRKHTSKENNSEESSKEKETNHKHHAYRKKHADDDSGRILQICLKKLTMHSSM